MICHILKQPRLKIYPRGCANASNRFKKVTCQYGIHYREHIKVDTRHNGDQLRRKNHFSFLKPFSFDSSQCQSTDYLLEEHIYQPANGARDLRSKIWPWVPRDSEPRITVLARASSNFRWESVGFEVLTAVVKKSIIFWDITPCNPLKVNRRFGWTYCLHLQGRRISRVRNQRESR
jgi:hypothetical protein